MTITMNQFDAALDKKHLLTHLFYKSWSAGTLSLDDLQLYGKQYYHHVKAFPCYISATHSNCAFMPVETRQILLENLIEEERGRAHHPALWLKFTKGLGLSDEEVEQVTLLPETRNLIETFLEVSRSSYAEGIGALYAYERQIPDTAKSKFDGLEKFYNITDPQTFIYFKLHMKADVEHANDTRELIEKLPPLERARAFAAADRVAQALWDLLTAIHEETMAAA
ncbi:MAG: CADD family putative folate metabolism protein [Gammaproteobacteria bacterium]|nr:CADD family putative folate metabolism protein [Gammaproteobacteria bacterium]